jgi:hypothetical protein
MNETHLPLALIEGDLAPVGGSISVIPKAGGPLTLALFMFLMKIA